MNGIGWFTIANLNSRLWGLVLGSASTKNPARVRKRSETRREEAMKSNHRKDGRSQYSVLVSSGSPASLDPRKTTTKTS